MEQVRRLYRDVRGVAAVETAFVTIFLLITLCGLIELTAFIDAIQRVNRAADQTASVVSSLPAWNGQSSKDDVSDLLQMGANTFVPSHGKIRLKLCKGDREFFNAGGKSPSGSVISCGLGPAAGPGIQSLDLDCDQTGPGSQEYVLVGAYCAYRPLVTLFGLFPNPYRISSVLRVPMRRDMGW